jgi:hypothetical protein
MKIAIVQFDNRPTEALGAMTALVERNAAYARRQGYDHHFVTAAPFDLPVYWQKPALCQRLLEDGYDAALWLDTDAVVHDQDRRIEDLFEGRETMVAAPDNPHWTGPFNAGVFATRQPGGARVMERWGKLFAGTKWTRTETAWMCLDEWAGPSYEQGAFTARLMDVLLQTGKLRMADWRVLQSPEPIPEAFTLHFPGPFRAKLAGYLKTLA